MCHQTVGLAQAELEKTGVPTVSVTMLPEITRRIRPPRALAVPFPLGYPLGSPNDGALQSAILRAMLVLLSRHDVPVLASFSSPPAF